MDYKSSGVNIKAGEETVDRIKELVKSTHNKNVPAGIGHFGAFYELDISRYKRPVLVSSVDGVGTKLKVAFLTGRHDTVGQDLVNHCVNDIAVCGAEPLYFLDYFATGRLDPDSAAKVIKGFAAACKENGVALIGGETAEMPGIYSDDEYDMSGTIVGVVEKDQILDGKNTQKGDVLIGFKSNGLHTNGYSLARKVLFEKYKIDDKPEGLDNNLGDELLKVHKSYLKLISALKHHPGLRAFSHITGGGIIGNTKRVVPQGLTININWNAWELPPVFKLIQETGNVSDEEMRNVFNIGIGLIAVVRKENSDDFIKKAKDIDDDPIIIGEIV